MIETLRYTVETFKREFSVGDWIIAGYYNSDKAQITAIGETSFIYKQAGKRNDYKAESIGYITRQAGWVKTTPPEVNSGKAD